MGVIYFMKLFGGAIVCDVPSELIDASQLREVPDNQEVFVGTVEDTDIDIIIELLEQVPEKNLGQALGHHIDEAHRFAGTQPEERNESTEFISTQVGSHKFVGRVDTVHTDKNYMSLAFGLIRLDEYETDVLITCILTTEGDTPISMQNRNTQKSVILQLADTFEVKDPSLFINN